LMRFSTIYSGFWLLNSGFCSPIAAFRCIPIAIE
jgi:hypothetical protein